MKFSFVLGQAEKHRLDYYFNQLLGALVIKVNEREIKRSVRLFNEPIREVHVFEVGHAEIAVVRIEKERKQLFGHRNRLYVNNRLVRVYDGF